MPKKATAAKGQAKAQTFREYATSAAGEIKIDREAGIIRGCKLLGVESANGRVYPVEVIAKASSLYEGAKVNVNHGREPGEPRGYEDRIGYVEGVTVRPDSGLYGNLRYNPKHPLAEQLLWDAEHAPGSVGFSHDVEARASKRPDGKMLVEEIIRVQSVDLVADPATTNGLFEQRDNHDRGGATVPKTLKEIVAKAKGNKWAGRIAKLIEADPAMGEAPVDAPVDAAGAPAEDPNAEIAAAFEKAALSILKKVFAGELDADEGLGKIKDLLGQKDQAAAPADGAPAPDAAAPAAEVKRLNAKLAVMLEAQNLGVIIDEGLMDAACAVEGEKRTNLLKRLAEAKLGRATGQKPTSREQGAAGGEQFNEAKITDGKSFAEFICG